MSTKSNAAKKPNLLNSEAPQVSLVCDRAKASDRKPMICWLQFTDGSRRALIQLP